jgi:hypothetical protein
MDNSKPIWQSKTVISVLVLIAATIMQQFGLGVISEGDQQNLTAVILSVIQGLAAIMAIVGRVTAKKTIGGS